ncbi:MAG TPA: hydrolase [Thermoanaerobaculia bacterium]|nr:hydrolase [Thermoanaerobaculia bacterium]
MDRPLPHLEPAATALVLIDLQHGVVARQTAPRPATEVVHACSRLVAAAHHLGVLVVKVRVTFAPDRANALRQDVDQGLPPAPPPGWDELVEEMQPAEGEVVVTKRQWGAFYGTNLDLELRRRGRRTLVLGGISTNFGVESTARDAWERNYQLILVEDAMAALDAEAHRFAVTRIFPRLGRVCTVADVLAAWAADATAGPSLSANPGDRRS